MTKDLPAIVSWLTQNVFKIEFMVIGSRQRMASLESEFINVRKLIRSPRTQEIMHSRVAQCKTGESLYKTRNPN